MPSCLELHTIPIDDAATYEMIQDADTVGVFQIESRAQMSMLPRLKPREFYDLVIEVAIVRPGPIQGNMVHPYLLNRKKVEAGEKVAYPSEELKGVLGRTLGVPLFQEQAMQIATIGAGFSDTEADQLRRSMAAWRRNGEMEKFHGRFVKGMEGRGYSIEFAERCFEQLKGFSEYGFPESHAASFAKLVAASAWIKRHHPAVFCAALLNSQPMGFYAPAQLVRDAREHGVTVLPVDVNRSEWDCTLEEEARRHASTSLSTGSGTEARREKHTWGWGGPAVRLGFRQVKGMGEVEAKNIVAARGGRAFGSVESVWRRAGVAGRTMRLLADADAFSSLGLSRRQALWEAGKLKEVEAPLFEGIEAAEESVALPRMPIGQEVRLDYATAELSLKRHPVGLVRGHLSDHGVVPAVELTRQPAGRWVKVAGLVLNRQRPGTAKGIVFATLEDETGVANLIIKPDVFERFRAAARHAQLLVAEGRLQKDEGGKVIHVMVYRAEDWSGVLQGEWGKSRDFH